MLAGILGPESKFPNLGSVVTNAFLKLVTESQLYVGWEGRERVHDKKTKLW